MCILSISDARIYFFHQKKKSEKPLKLYIHPGTTYDKKDIFLNTLLKLSQSLAQESEK